MLESKKFVKDQKVYFFNGSVRVYGVVLQARRANSRVFTQVGKIVTKSNKAIYVDSLNTT